MDVQCLFAYGTLKTDQPEHVLHCIPPLSVKPARAAGALWRLREGYPILQIDPTLSLLDATDDPAADWAAAQTLAVNAFDWKPADHWIEGELFEYPLESETLKRMDQWENFQPARPSVYQRRVIPLQDSSGKSRIAWAYVCFSPPQDATRLSANRW